MFLLPPAIRRLINEMKGKKKRVFSLDEEFLSVLHKAAEDQNRPEDEILADWLDSGVKHSSKGLALDARWHSLTRREREVLALVCLVDTNSEICETLGISPHTVKTHLENIFDKFGVHSKRELRLLLQDWDFVNWWDSRQM